MNWKITSVSIRIKHSYSFRTKKTLYIYRYIYVLQRFQRYSYLSWAAIKHNTNKIIPEEKRQLLKLHNRQWHFVRFLLILICRFKRAFVFKNNKRSEKCVGRGKRCTQNVTWSHANAFLSACSIELRYWPVNWLISLLRLYIVGITNSRDKFNNRTTQHIK